MIIVLKNKSGQKDLSLMRDILNSNNIEFKEVIFNSEEIFILFKKIDSVLIENIISFGFADRIVDVKVPYKLCSREFKNEATQINIGSVVIGGIDPVIMAGPCSVESEEQIWEIACEAASMNANILRGGVYKPRTSPYSFQGLGLKAAKWLCNAGKHFNLPVVSEVMEINDIDELYPYVDILQIGARNMQNFKLLKEAGKTLKPILLKRGNSATLNEFFMSAEYILSEGNSNVILCERGIRTFVEYTRNTFDLNIIPMVKELSHLPIIVDASHATGKRELVNPVTLAGLTAGADGFIVEIHPRPKEALSDGEQSLTFPQFRKLMDDWIILKDSVLAIRHKKVASGNSLA